MADIEFLLRVAGLVVFVFGIWKLCENWHDRSNGASGLSGIDERRPRR